MSPRRFSWFIIPLALLITLVACGTDADEAACGNGVLEAGEACDPGIASGEGACPTADTCTSDDACTPTVLSGSAEACTAECVSESVTACADDDGCCPAACGPTDDSDCRVATGEACPCDTGSNTLALLPCDACQQEWCWQEAPGDNYCTERCDTSEQCAHLGSDWTCVDGLGFCYEGNQ